jgi:hypothetical protein
MHDVDVLLDVITLQFWLLYTYTSGDGLRQELGQMKEMCYSFYHSGEPLFADSYWLKYLSPPANEKFLMSTVLFSWVQIRDWSLGS